MAAGADQALPEPWHAAWPPAGLEWLAACPICCDSSRTVLHEGLIDNTFRVAAGRWTLWRCANCTGAYLNPRPTAETIGAAYESYYTHASTATAAPAGPLALLRRLRRQWSAAYAEQRYGAQRTRSGSWGGLLGAALVPMVRRIADREWRHLPHPTSPPGLVLDVGCGDGAFLAVARDCGWQVLGLEPDFKAARLAASRGVEVIVGGLDALAGHGQAFDVITLSHVIEHMHDPVTALRSCHRLLRPGGRLWIETPNVDSFGHREFAANWRGLEAPRHLVLFNPAALRRALKVAGFGTPRALSAPSARRWIFERSVALSMGRWPDDARAMKMRQRCHVWLYDLLDGIDGGRCEFITLVADKGA
jgi:2-polyprenyl-3-methyl-5-hydroxy-6-metoxy-1,4-benzoquinol methylase